MATSFREIQPVYDYAGRVTLTRGEPTYTSLDK